MFPKNTLEKKLDVQIATSSLMDNAIQLWMQMYENTPPWLGGPSHVKSLNLPSVIAEEFSRLTLTEFSIELTGSARATFLQDQLSVMLSNISNITELWCALGGIVLKPFAAGEDENGNPDHIELDVVQANRFYPTAFNSNREVTGAIFVDTKRIGHYIYTRLEYHSLVGDKYTVLNRAFRSERLYTTVSENDNINAEHPFAEEIKLSQVDEWKGLQPCVEMHGIKQPFFVYIKQPRANTIDPHSPLSTSVYARASDLIKEADKQYSRILWEYEAKETAIDADVDLFDTDRSGRPIIPAGRERLFRTYEADGTDKNTFFKTFSPEIRDNSMFNGLNKLFRNIEFLCGLAYGTISDVSEVEKTAEEIRASKQRSYATVNAMQTALEDGLRRLIGVMDTLCTLYGIVPPGAIETTVTWGDGVLEDTEKEYQRRWNMVLAGKLKLEKFYAWYFGCTEEAAMELIPQQTQYPVEE